MPDLHAVEFTGELISQDFVQGFDCGTEPWSKFVSDWIKGRPQGHAVLESMAKKTQVWLFFDADDNMVGYGSLGPSRWIEPQTRDRVDVSMIPMLGVDKRYQRLGYGRRILSHLRARAELVKAERPVLGLLVDVRNLAAIALYQSEGFVSRSEAQGRFRMWLSLNK